MHNKHLLIISFVLGLFFCNQCLGQIINIEKSRKDDTTRWAGNIDFNLNFTKNTKAIWFLGNRTGLQYTNNRHIMLFLTDISFVQADNEELVSNGFEHIRYNYLLGQKKKFAIEAFEQVQYNKIQKIKLRMLAGAGGRYSFISSDTANLNLGITPMYEYEELTDDSTFSRTFRISNYLSFDFQVFKKALIRSITYYQPNAANFSDYRISNETSFSIQLTGSLNFKVTYNMLYDSKPPIEVPNLIYGLSNGLGWKF